MLETEDVDDDYFTPVTSASLANIFGKSVTDVRSENESLKYTPPKAVITNQPPEDSKATSCVFACALVGYEWHNNVYTQKGKLGFAIIQVIRTESHNIVLYDSNKTTLSNTRISSNLKITVIKNNYISYYDDQAKNWGLYGEQNEIKKITDLLKMLNASIIMSTDNNSPDNNPPEPTKSKEVISLQEESKEQAESYSDSSINRKTKASILNRMANMGHSVLPPSAITAIKSDSSDTNDNEHHIKAVRHKPVKGMTKRYSADKALLEHQKFVEIHTNVEEARIGQGTEKTNTRYAISDQLVPLANTLVTSPSGIDMNLFITEQRISNSELRINMGRMTDKVDQIINKINNLELKDKNEGTAIVNTEILHKLLREYENKIKNYEDIFQKLGTDPQTKISTNLQSTQSPNVSPNNEEVLQNKIHHLENILKEKDNVVSSIQNEVKTLLDAKEQNDVLQKYVSRLEAELAKNNIVLKELTEANENLKLTSNDSDIENRIKSLMNEIYQAVATNFENGETYSGESIKKSLGMVIKKVTLGALMSS